MPKTDPIVLGLLRRRVDDIRDQLDRIERAIPAMSYLDLTDVLPKLHSVDRHFDAAIRELRTLANPPEVD